jgi:hypothetical protein
MVGPIQPVALCPNREELCKNTVRLKACNMSSIQVSQELSSLIQDLIPELISSQKRHIHMGPIDNVSGVMRF